MRGPEEERRLSLASVGLWHRMPAGDTPLEPMEILTLAGDPTAWHPHGELDDVDQALDGLIALGSGVRQSGVPVAR